MLASLEMALPVVAGYWIDQKLGTVVVFMVLGVIAGCTLGMWHLMRMIANEKRIKNSNEDSGK
jgi:F0F1-type ATP synthase assembly protein I